MSQKVYQLLNDIAPLPTAHGKGEKFIFLTQQDTQTSINLYTIRGETPGIPYNNGEDLWGGEEGVPPYGSKTGQGIKTKYSYNQLTAGYLLNPANRLGVEASIVYRSRKSSIVNESEFYFSFGIKTSLYNLYHDF